MFLNCKPDNSRNEIKKWKYKVVEITFKSKRGIEPFLNEYGKAGWELIQKSSNEYIFKKEQIQISKQ